MTQKEIIEYNKKCAEFIGAIPCKDWQGEDGYEYEHELFYHTQWSNKFQDNLELYSYRYSQLQFHSDWNWIMEVVEAIKIKIGNPTTVTIACFNGDINKALMSAKKEAVVQAINQFLDWYNKNN